MVFALNEIMIFNMNIYNLISSTFYRVGGEKTKTGDIDIMDIEINAMTTCRNLSFVTRKHEGQTISREIKTIEKLKHYTTSKSH
jgi:hypothetical protein